MKRLHALSVIATIILSSTFGAIAFVAIFPYLDFIGKLLVGLLAVGAGCGCYLALLWTYHYHCILAARRRQARLASWLVTSGDVSIYMRPDGSYDHVSAEHVSAALPPPAVTIQEIKEIDKEKIIEYHQKHLSLRSIAKATGHSYYQVQKTTAEWDALVNQSAPKNSGIDPSDWRSQT